MSKFGSCECAEVTWIWHPKVSENYTCQDCNRKITWNDSMKHYICEQCGKSIRVSHSTKKHRICARCIRIGRVP